jgi:hypothetical protein
MGTLAFLYLLVYLIDPYDVFLFSPDADRSPISSKRRHFNPGIARKPYFDSFIMGTSTAMLLKPENLNKILDTKIANLSLPAGSPYEQMRMASLFMQHHQSLNLVIVTVDEVWCTIDGAEHYMDVNNDQLVDERKLKEWRYSSNFFKQLPPLTNRIIKDSKKQLMNILGLKDFSYGADGYADFTKRFARKYDQHRIQQNLYADAQGKIAKDKVRKPIQPAIFSSDLEKQSWRFPDIMMLQEWLMSLPITTRKILFFPPYHHYKQAAKGSKEELVWNECKQRVANMSLSVEKLTVFDFMVRSSITNNDANYWDPLHYTVNIANKIEKAFSSVADKSVTKPVDYFKILNAKKPKSH